jgi:ribosomal protein S18 acetylase RimI-like enzyme
MDIKYEKASNDDIDALFAFNKELIDNYEDKSSIEYDKVLKWIRNKLETNINAYTRIIIDGKKAGYFSFLLSGKTMELDDLYIFPEYRNKGIGSAVIEKCLSETKLPIILYVFNKNSGAVRLYERFGFEIFKSVGNTRYIMRNENR